MYSEELQTLQRKKDYLVVKHNDLIQKTRFRLSLTEQKAIAYICSMIRPAKNSDDFCLNYEFDIREFCKICDMEPDCGKNYNDVKNVLKKLRDSSMWLQMEDGTERTVAWLSDVIMNKHNGVVQIQIHPIMAPYLFSLNSRFTQYWLRNILKMRSSFSIRLYEILKSYLFINTKEFSIDELKVMLNVEKVKSYDRFPDFRRRVLETAINEINALTDINVTFKPIKSKKKVEKISFSIKQKNPIQRMIAYSDQGYKLHI